MDLSDSNPPAAVYEPIPAPDTFLTGVEIEDCGDHMRMVGFSDRATHGGIERIIVLRAVMTRVHFHRAIDTALKVMTSATH